MTSLQVIADLTTGYPLLTWNRVPTAPTTGAYTVHRAVVGRQSTLDMKADAGALRFLDTRLDWMPGASYAYSVSIVAANGSLLTSNTAAFTFPAAHGQATLDCQGFALSNVLRINHALTRRKGALLTIPGVSASDSLQTIANAVNSARHALYQHGLMRKTQTELEQEAATGAQTSLGTSVSMDMGSGHPLIAWQPRPSSDPGFGYMVVRIDTSNTPAYMNAPLSVVQYLDTTATVGSVYRYFVQAMDQASQLVYRGNTVRFKVRLLSRTPTIDMQGGSLLNVQFINDMYMPKQKQRVVRTLIQNSGAVYATNTLLDALRSFGLIAGRAASAPTMVLDMKGGAITALLTLNNAPAMIEPADPVPVAHAEEGSIVACVLNIFGILSEAQFLGLR